jgi:hypothetical protein
MLHLQAGQAGWTIARWDSPLLDRGTGTVTQYKPKEPAENLRSVFHAKQLSYGRICECYDPYAHVVAYIDVVGGTGAPSLESTPACRIVRIKERKVSLRIVVCALVIIVIRTVTWQKFAQIGTATGWPRRRLLYGTASCLRSSPCQRDLVGMRIAICQAGSLGS